MLICTQLVCEQKLPLEAIELQRETKPERCMRYGAPYHLNSRLTYLNLQASTPDFRTKTSNASTALQADRYTNPMLGRSTAGKITLIITNAF